MNIHALKKTIRLASLGEGLFGKITTFVLILSRRARWKFGFSVHETTIRLKIHSVLCTISISGKPDDFGVLNEILVDEEYKITEINDPRVIVDAGGNIGISALYFATRFPNAIIYTIEADPTTFARLQKNVASFPTIVPINAALTSRDGEDVVFYHSERSVSSSLRRRSSADSEVRVRSISLDGLMRTYAISVIDMCKFDIEGGEADAFDVVGLEKKIRFCIGEVHGDLMPISRPAFLEFFSGYTTTMLELGKDRCILRALARPLVDAVV